MSNSEEKPNEEGASGPVRRQPCNLWCRFSSVVVVWLLLFGLLVGARYYTFHSPIVHDEGVFLYGGMAWAADELAYRDFWDHKPPGITLFHALPIRLFGYSILAVRLHEVFWLTVSATVFFFLCRTHLSMGPSILAVLFYAFFVSSKLIIRSGGLTEESALTFHALSYVFALRRRGSPGLNFFLAGLFLALAAQFRQPFGLSIVFVALCVLWRPEGLTVPFRRKVGLLLFLAVGAVLPEVVCSSYFFLKGIWWEYFEASYVFNFIYAGGSLDPDVLGPGVLGPALLFLSAIPSNVSDALTPDALGMTPVLGKHIQVLKATGPHLLSPFLAAPLLWWLPPRLRRVGALLIVAFLCDFVAISLGGRYYEHYYLQAAISSCFLLGVMLQGVYDGLRPRALRGKQPGLPGPLRRITAVRGLYILLCVLVAGMVLEICITSTVGAVKQYVRDYKSGLESRKRPSGQLRTQLALANAVRVLTKPDERILLLGASPTSIYFASERLAGARYYHLSPFFRNAFAESMGEEHRQRFMSDLKERRPVLIILAKEERQIYFAGLDVVEKNKAAAFLLPYLEENYTPFESFYPRSKIRRDLEWIWYGRTCSFLVRDDMVEEVEGRIERAVP